MSLYKVKHKNKTDNSQIEPCVCFEFLFCLLFSVKEAIYLFSGAIHLFFFLLSWFVPQMYASNNTHSSHHLNVTLQTVVIRFIIQKKDPLTISVLLDIKTKKKKNNFHQSNACDYVDEHIIEENKNRNVSNISYWMKLANTYDHLALTFISLYFNANSTTAVTHKHIRKDGQILCSLLFSHFPLFQSLGSVLMLICLIPSMFAQSHISH